MKPATSYSPVDVKTGHLRRFPAEQGTPVVTQARAIPGTICSATSGASVPVAR